MLALRIIVDTEVWTSALRHMCYPDCVDVACTASKVDLFQGTVRSLMWTVMVAGATSVNDDHTLSRGAMGNSRILLWCMRAMATKHELSVDQLRSV